MSITSTDQWVYSLQLPFDVVGKEPAKKAWNGTYVDRVGKHPAGVYCKPLDEAPFMLTLASTANHLEWFGYSKPSHPCLDVPQLLDASFVLSEKDLEPSAFPLGKSGVGMQRLVLTEETLTLHSPGTPFCICTFRQTRSDTKNTTGNG